MRTLAILALLFGCGSSDQPTAAQRGQAVYMSTCITCHGPNPAASGPLGPPIKGSSRELLEARVIRGEYPPGYAPKRPTKAMLPLPQLAPSIDDLHAYLK